MSRRLVVEADGGARGNPGPAGWGAVVRDAETGKVLVERSEAIGVATNNVAEYRGVIAGLAAAAELAATVVEVRMDSKLVVEQMSGRWRIKHPGLRPLAAEAAALVRRFESVSWQWVPRARNAHADRLANEAMDAAAAGGAGDTAAAAADTAAATGGAGDTVAATGGARDTAAATGGARDAAAATGGGRERAAWEPPDAPPTRLLLVRHGETGLNAERRYSGRGDVPLAPSGIAQAEAVARRIGTLAPRVAAVVTSPLVRCTDTAAPIAAATGSPPVITDPDLIECDLGEWEGRTFAEVRAGWGKLLEQWQAGADTPAPGGESLPQVAERVRRAVAGLRQAYPAATVVVVSHVWPLKLMLRDALAAGDGFLHRFLLDPVGLSIMDSYPDGTVAVRSVNDTAHLS